MGNLIEWANASTSAGILMRRKGRLPQHILLIQDAPADAATVQDALISSADGPFHVEWVRRCSEGLVRLAATRQQPRPNGIAAVLVDLRLPDRQGIEAFDRLFEAAPQVPILVLTAAGDEAIAELAVQRGAQDFLLKARLDNYL